MSSSKDNTNYKKTSFLIGSNSEFINEFYSDYLTDPESLPESWKAFFDGLSEEQKLIYDDLQGPSWSPERKNKKIRFNTEDLKEEEKEFEIDLKSINESVKAIALIRAYRIRGHLIANLDPLEMMERKYLEDLNPADHGFKKEDYNKKIYVGEYMRGGYSTIKEILSFFKKIYCSKIGVEYMHISDPIEKKWFRERMVFKSWRKFKKS